MSAHNLDEEMRDQVATLQRLAELLSCEVGSVEQRVQELQRDLALLEMARQSDSDGARDLTAWACGPVGLPLEMRMRHTTTTTAIPEYVANLRAQVQALQQRAIPVVEPPADFDFAGAAAALSGEEFGEFTEPMRTFGEPQVSIDVALLTRLSEDAARWRFLASRYVAADFSGIYTDLGSSAIVFDIGPTKVSASPADTVDRARGKPSVSSPSVGSDPKKETA